MGFDRWMAACLYDAEHGYYANPARQRTGRKGDFFTSVSVGPIFGRALALAFASVWEQAGRPEEFWLVEYGAEDGQLAVDMLALLQTVGGAEFAAAVRYGIVETIAAKQAVQRKKLSETGFVDKIEWLGEGETKPVGVVFGNEVVDAQPVQLVERTAEGWAQRLVGLNRQGGFVWRTQANLDIGRGPLAAVENYPVGYQAELRISADLELLNGMASRVERGAVLLVDYGFAEQELYSLSRPGGTLQCYRHHQRSDDPLAHPGEQDISAHVNFSLLAQAGQALGLKPVAWVDQQRSLAGLLTAHRGDPDKPTLLAGLDDPARGRRQLQTLMHPESLGAKFHWLWLAKGADMVSNATPALAFASPGDLAALTAPD